MVAGKQNNLPIVILDSDQAGEDYKGKLLKDLHRDQEHKIITIKDLLNRDNVEIEDLIPSEIMERPIEYLIKDRDFDFEHSYEKGRPVIQQIEEWGKIYNIPLPLGYKVQLAKDVKHELLKSKYKNNLG